VRPDEEEIYKRARQLMRLGIVSDYDETIVLLGDINETGDLGVAVDLGSEMKYAFFRRADTFISTSNPDLIRLALERMRALLVLDDLAEIECQEP
jgi:hypothetical protein